MARPSNITPVIVDALYDEALSLAEEARFVFAGVELKSACQSDSQDQTQITLSCEALRTTTRLMHALAWLINHRAFFTGDLSEFQLRRHGELPPANTSSKEELDLLVDERARDICTRSINFYARITRLDHAWCDRFTMDPPAIERLRNRVGSAFPASA